MEKSQGQAPTPRNQQESGLYYEKAGQGLLHPSISNTQRVNVVGLGHTSQHRSQPQKSAWQGPQHKPALSAGARCHHSHALSTVHPLLAPYSELRQT